MAEKNSSIIPDNYSSLIKNISFILKTARKKSARAVDIILTATYWEIGRRIVEYEFKGMDRSEYYGDKLLENLSKDLQNKFGRGFSRPNLTLMKLFYQEYPYEKICQTPSNKSFDFDSTTKTLSGKSLLIELSNNFTLPWSHYVRLLSVKSFDARSFYEVEALREGWSVRQLDRQISWQFYERTLLSKIKASMLKKGERPKPEDFVTPEEEIKDPFILEFLDLKDENPPVGIILCAEKDNAVAKYSLEGLPNKILASEYKLALPDEKLLAKEIERTRRLLERRKVLKQKQKNSE